MTPALVALGGGLGAAARYLVAARFDRTFPLGTLAVNLVGSFLLGLFGALALSGQLMALLGVGVCGGFTTYSSFAHQAMQLGWSGRGVAYVAGTLMGTLACAALGFALGRAL